MNKYIAIIIRHAGRLLVVKHRSGPWKEQWFLPGCNADETELYSSIAETVNKIIYQQTGYFVKAHKIVFSEYCAPDGSNTAGLYIYISASLLRGGTRTRLNRHSRWLTPAHMKHLQMPVNIPEAMQRYKCIFKWLGNYHAAEMLQERRYSLTKHPKY
jgi:hypothetical protein